ncbi:4-hydroxythreonine-4-phosphate dehydrogenase PdxA [Flavobacteriaceae bacterium]|nr:4-hydroxythreonine-4-phosphate dehydrogenase PdxA [Flavobacteriaceae bacterium]
MSEISKIRVGISVGDPNGIGFEIILKTFEDKRIFDFFTPIVFAHSKNFIEERKKLGCTTSVFTLKNIKNPNKGQLNVVDVWSAPFPIAYGKEDLEAGAHAISSLEAATAALKKGEVDVLVTAPIHKKSIQSDTFRFPGHTDYLNEQLEGDSLMFMVTDSLKVALMSDHIPLKEVVGYLNEEKINAKIASLEKSLSQDFGIQRPKIAVLGINPHTGDNGVIGDEDDTLLTPVIKKWNEKGSLVFGPYAADGFFGNQRYTKFDGVLATYHDQGLIPFKTLSFGQGVNFTAGLSHVRTSPDHGTAFDIAGKGVADASSFSEAVYTARAIFLQRKEVNFS